MNELDQFVKHDLKAKCYLRYCDDFLILSWNKDYLLQCTIALKQFLLRNLGLELHPKKIIMRKLNWGIDFLGYVVLPYHRLIRPKTKKRISKKFLNGGVSKQSLASYLGYLKHANAYWIGQELKNREFIL